MKLNFILKKSLYFSLGLFLFLGSACNNLVEPSNSGIGGTTPTYQGMTVSSATTPLQNILYANDVNQENPFEDSENNQIESSISEFLGNNVENEEFAYYARANETVRVTINIFNPDSYVILSFNLNGRRYQSFEFREGSNSTRLLMDVALRSEVGLQELTLDEIKYVDGTEIKDAILFGETTVRVGVLYPNLPEVTVVEKTIGKTQLGLDINVSDVDGLIANAPKPLYVFFYDGNALTQKELSIGENTIVFDNLKSQTVYQYAIATLFDVLDGKGHSVRLFTKEAIQTNRFLSMSLSPTKTSMSFDVTVDDANSMGDITKVTLSRNGILVEEILGQTEGTFNNLLTNNTYVVKAHFNYQFDGESDTFEETEEQTGVTLANLTPTFTFSDVVAGQEDIVFEYTVTDTDGVGSLTKIELLKGTAVVETLTEFESTMFEGLLSNNDYQLKATYTYDLNDGVGVRTLVVNSNTKTLAKATPTFTFSDVVAGQEDIVFEYTVTDTDGVGSLTKIELLKGTAVVETLTEFESTMFEGLLSNNDYQLKATYTYDLNDGVGVRTLVVNSNTKTLAKATPNIIIERTTSPLIPSPGLTYTLYDNSYYLVTGLGSFSNEIVIIGGYYNDLPIRGTTQQALMFASSIKRAILLDTVTVFGTETFYGVPLESVYFESVTPPQINFNVYGYNKNVITFVKSEAKELYVSITNNPLWTQDVVPGITTFEENGIDSDEFFKGKRSISMNGDILRVNLLIDDINNVGELKSSTLRLPNNTIQNGLINGNSVLFENVPSKENVIFEAIYDYDLNDGLGNRKIIFQQNIFTFIINGLGTKNSPFELDSADKFEMLRVYNVGYYFILKNDIDFNDSNWNPINKFSGHIDGNNLKIKNFRTIKTYATGESSHAMFKQFEGSIINVHFENIFISVNSNFSTNVSLIAAKGSVVAHNISITGKVLIRSISEVNFGALVGYGNVISATEISTNLNVDIESSNNVFFGLLQGRGLTSNFSKLNLIGDVIINNDSGIINAGGLVGQSYENSVINQGIINLNLIAYSAHEKRIGGAIGIVNGNLTMSNMITLGKLENYQSEAWTYTGGLIGYIEGSAQTFKFIEKSISFIDIVHVGYDPVGNLFGNVTGGTAFSQLYRSQGQTIVNDIFENINSKDASNSKITRILYSEYVTSEFYIEKLNLDETFFDISNVIQMIIDFNPLGDGYPSAMYIAVGNAFGDQFIKWDANNREYLFKYDIDSKIYTLNSIYIFEGTFAIVIFKTWNGRIGFNSLTSIPVGFELAAENGDIKVNSNGVGVYNLQLLFKNDVPELIITLVN